MLSSEGLLKALTARTPRFTLLVLTVVILPAVWSRKEGRRKSALYVLHLLLFGPPQPTLDQPTEQDQRLTPRTYTRSMATDGLMTAENVADVLLIWLSSHTGRDVGKCVDVKDFAGAEEVYVQRVEEAARLLHERGHVEELRTFGCSAVSITHSGLREADRILAERENHGARFSYVLDRLVAEAIASPEGTVQLLPFVATTIYLGEHLEITVVLRAARSLREYGLAVLTPAEGHPTTLTLTPRGELCAMSGQKVNQYVSEQTPAPAGPVFTQNVYGGTAAQGMNVTQNVGVQADQLADLVRQLRSFATTLPAAEQEDFLVDVEVLEDTEQGAQARLSAGQRIMLALNAAPGAQAIVEIVGQVIGALGG
ncbi:hypothetical protein [Streptomyces microflavus]|uniref:hypothetical protein n=1 Tax=Streptomyces microflavus TaxID=1919 RepID=UPI0033D744B9